MLPGAGGPEIKPADGASHSITGRLSPRHSFLRCLVGGILTSLSGNSLAPLFLQTEQFLIKKKKNLGMAGEKWASDGCPPLPTQPVPKSCTRPLEAIHLSHPKPPGMGCGYSSGGNALSVCSEALLIIPIYIRLLNVFLIYFIIPILSYSYVIYLGARQSLFASASVPPCASPLNSCSTVASLRAIHSICFSWPSFKLLFSFIVVFFKIGEWVLM